MPFQQMLEGKHLLKGIKKEERYLIQALFRLNIDVNPH